MSELKDPMLKQAENQIESQITPETRDDYFRVVVAGMDAGLTDGPKGILASLKLSKDPVVDAAKGAASMVLILRKETKNGDMPLKSMTLGGFTLMFMALDYVNTMKFAEIGNPELDRAAHVFVNTLYAGLGITPQKLTEAVMKAHAVTQNPAIQAKMDLKAGVTTHPNAPPPGPVPGAAPPRAPLLGMPAA